MAIALDASTPARWTRKTTGVDGHLAAFTAPPAHPAGRVCSTTPTARRRGTVTCSGFRRVDLDKAGRAQRRTKARSAPPRIFTAITVSAVSRTVTSHADMDGRILPCRAAGPPNATSGLAWMWPGRPWTPSPPTTKADRPPPRRSPHEPDPWREWRCSSCATRSGTPKGAMSSSAISTQLTTRNMRARSTLAMATNLRHGGSGVTGMHDRGRGRPAAQVVSDHRPGSRSRKRASPVSAAVSAGSGDGAMTRLEVVPFVRVPVGWMRCVACSDFRTQPGRMWLGYSKTWEDLTIECPSVSRHRAGRTLQTYRRENRAGDRLRAARAEIRLRRRETVRHSTRTITKEQSHGA
jgi:hypothetical protein